MVQGQWECPEPFYKAGQKEFLQFELQKDYYESEA